VDASYVIILGVLTTRRLFQGPRGGGPRALSRRASAFARAWLPACGVLLSCAAAAVLLLAHAAAMAEIAPTLSSALLENPPAAGGFGLGAEAALVRRAPARALLGYEAGGGLQAGWSLGLSAWAKRAVAPFQLSNGYGLFRSMTGVGPSVLDSQGRVVSQVARPELVMEVSMGEDCDAHTGDAAAKACQWLPFEFHYKPGNVARAPAWVAPHQPRLDWQMWFAALSYDWLSSQWFPAVLQSLCRRCASRRPPPKVPPRVREVAHALLAPVGAAL
jgi:hypothetical protein